MASATAYLVPIKKMHPKTTSGSSSGSRFVGAIKGVGIMALASLIAAAIPRRPHFSGVEKNHVHGEVMSTGGLGMTRRDGRLGLVAAAASCDMAAAAIKAGTFEALTTAGAASWLRQRRGVTPASRRYEGDGSGGSLPEPLRGFRRWYSVLGTPYATTLRRHSLTHPTRNTIQMFRRRKLAELCLWISARCFRESGAGNSAWPALEPAGHRECRSSSAWCHCPSGVEGLLEGLRCPDRYATPAQRLRGGAQLMAVSTQAATLGSVGLIVRNWQI